MELRSLPLVWDKARVGEARVDENNVATVIIFKNEYLTILVKYFDFYDFVYEKFPRPHVVMQPKPAMPLLEGEIVEINDDTSIPNIPTRDEVKSYLQAHKDNIIEWSWTAGCIVVPAIFWYSLGKRSGRRSARVTGVESNQDRTFIRVITKHGKPVTFHWE